MQRFDEPQFGHPWKRSRVSFTGNVQASFKFLTKRFSVVATLLFLVQDVDYVIIISHAI